MSEPYQREVVVFEAALQLPPGQREGYLEQACGGDAELLQRLRTLLIVNEGSTDFMAGSPAAARTEAIPVPLSEGPGDRIGPYKLLQVIGEGGCGVVYMAEQEQPIHRRVALKIIKLGMDTRQVIARFEAERQALALMDHPNIAKVLDAGATATGRPYFVMELVRGLKITEYCDEKRLSTQQRLQLFLQVCQAVQHAHQKGIIHRDLKPSNILVTVNDGAAVTKVIDFGIAKATTGGRLTDKTIFTAFEQFIGTPAYMSPEQAEITSLDIDTRSDIYSLGVLLYELLTGQTPFDAKELLRVGLEEMRRTLREKEPARPSTRLGTLGAEELTTTAQRRGLEGPKLVNVLKGDLDWIVMKCLEKDRARRYETANGLARDIQRHLNNEPVVACPPGGLYRFQKLVRRNKVAFSVAAAIGLVLVAGVVVSTWQAVRARRAETEQTRLRQQAERAQTNEARERLKAEHAASLEAEQRARAQALAEENRINLYAARIKLADETFKAGDVARVVQLLDSLRPQQGQEDLRSFDWYYLWQLCHSERLVCQASGRVLCTAFSPDGRLLALAGDDRLIRLCDSATGAERGQLIGHTGRVASVAFCPDGKRIVSAGADATVRFWELATGKELRTLRTGTNSIRALTFSRAGNLLVGGEGETSTGEGNPLTTYFPCVSPGGIWVWNASTYELERKIEGLTNGIIGLAFSRDGRRLAFSGIPWLHPVTKLYDLSADHELATQTNFQGVVVSLSFTPDGRDLVAADWHPWHDSGEITVLDGQTLEQKRVLAPDAGRVLCIALSPDGKKLASAGVDRTARLWDYTSGEELATYYGHDRPVSSLAFAPDGRALATASWDKTGRVWDLESSPARQRIETFQCFSVAFSPQGKLLASAGIEAEVRDAASGRLVRSLTEFTTKSDGHVAFSPDGSLLAAAEIDGTVHLWDTRTWEHRLAAKDAALSFNTDAWPLPGYMLNFSPDSKSVVEGFGKMVPFWNASDGRLSGIITNSDTVRGLAFTPDGRTLLIGGDVRVSLFDLPSKSFGASFSSACYFPCASSDGRWLASALRAGNEIVLRDLPSLKIRPKLTGHKDKVFSLAFSHDGRLLASGSWDGTIKVWHVASGQELLTIPSQGGVVWSVAFAADDRTVAFATGSSEAKGSGAVTLLRAASEADVARHRKFTRLPLQSHGELLAGIPKRAEQCPGNLIDLSDFYNAGFPFYGVPLEPGLQTLGGVQFDVRGIVMLSCAHQDLAWDFPPKVEGIRIGCRCQTLHFLQAAQWVEEGGTAIGEYAVHFANGQLERIPLVYGENLVNWWCPPGEPAVLGPATRAVWRGENDGTKRYGMELRFYDFRWQNPHPEIEIESVDFQSSLATSGPFLLAITAE
jgi:WD40 repeat protein/serine/threonine protein kinase